MQVEKKIFSCSTTPDPEVDTRIQSELNNKYTNTFKRKISLVLYSVSRNTQFQHTKFWLKEIEGRTNKQTNKQTDGRTDTRSKSSIEMSSLSDYDSSIKNMKLYNHFERVDNELKAAGHKDGSPLKPDDLYAYDHMVSIYLTCMYTSSSFDPLTFCT